MEPEETEGKLPKFYQQKGYKDWKDIRTNQLRATITIGKVNIAGIRTAMKETNTGVNYLDKELGVVSASSKLSNSARWQLSDIEKVALEFGFEPSDLIAKGEPRDENVYIPKKWVNYEKVKALVGNYSKSEFRKKIGGEKKWKLNQKTQFKLSELKNVGSLKFVMTREGLEGLEEFLNEYRPEGYRENKRFSGARMGQHAKRIRL